MSDTKMTPGGIAFGPAGDPVRGVQHVEIAQALEVEVKRQRQRAEAAERDAASLRERVGALAATLDYGINATDADESPDRRTDAWIDGWCKAQDRIVVMLRALSAPSSSPAATLSGKIVGAELLTNGTTLITVEVQGRRAVQMSSVLTLSPSIPPPRLPVSGRERRDHQQQRGGVMPFFRKKPVVIEAVLFRGFSGAGVVTNAWPASWDVSPWRTWPREGPPLSLVIPTLEGDLYAVPGDWIVRGVKGEFYPCKSDIFAATYEPAPSPAATDTEGAGEETT